MDINLHVIRDELPSWNLRGNLPGNHLKALLAYPQVCDSLPDNPDDRILYILDASALPSPDRHLRFSAICFGEPEEDQVMYPANVLWTNADPKQANDLMNDLVRVFSKYCDWERGIADVFERGLALEEVGKLTQPLVPNAIGAVGLSFRYLFASYPEVENASAQYAHDRDAYLADGAFINSADIADIIADEGYTRALGTREPIVCWSDRFACNMVICNIWIENVPCAQVLMNDYLAPLCKRDLFVVRQLCDMLAKHLSPAEIYGLAQPPLVSEVLERLLSHRLTPEDKIARLLDLNDWDMHDQFAVLHLSLHQEAHAAVIEPLAFAIAQKTRNDCFLIKGSAATFVFDLTKMGTAIDGLAASLEEGISGMPVDAFLSSTFDDFREIFYYQQQAIRAGELGARKEPAKTLHRFEDNALPYLLDRSIRGSVPGTLVPDGLKALVAYDAKHGTDHVGLLRMYLDSDRNAAVTSRELFIHRNTLVNRLERIDKVSHLDLDDPDMRLRLSVALRLLH